jgi:hypothetical protein
VDSSFVGKFILATALALALTMPNVDAASPNSIGAGIEDTIGISLVQKASHPPQEYCALAAPDLDANEPFYSAVTSARRRSMQCLASATASSFWDAMVERVECVIRGKSARVA